MWQLEYTDNMIQYNIKKLIKGYKIKPSLKGLTLVAVPSKFSNKTIKITHKEERMVITKDSPLLHNESFMDKFGRNKQYTLYYYEWKPNKLQQSLF